MYTVTHYNIHIIQYTCILSHTITYTQYNTHVYCHTITYTQWTYGGSKTRKNSSGVKLKAGSLSGSSILTSDLKAWWSSHDHINAQLTWWSLQRMSPIQSTCYGCQHIIMITCANTIFGVFIFYLQIVLKMYKFHSQVAIINI